MTDKRNTRPSAPLSIRFTDAEKAILQRKAGIRAICRALSKNKSPIGASLGRLLESELNQI